MGRDHDHDASSKGDMTKPIDWTRRHMPRGVGVYSMGLSAQVHGTPLQAAQRAKDHGLSFVMLLGCWQDGPGKHADSNRSDLPDYGAAFREAGVDVWVWGYPWGTIEQIPRFVQRMRRAAKDAGAVGLLLDPELGFKGDGAKHMPELLRQTLDSLDESLGVGITSYPIPQWHPDMDWAAMGGFGFGSPQTYSVDLQTAIKAIRLWRGLGWGHIVSSVPAYGANSRDRMAAYAGAIGEHADALCFWQWPQLDASEWKTVEILAKRYDDVAPERSVA